MTGPLPAAPQTQHSRRSRRACAVSNGAAAESTRKGSSKRQDNSRCSSSDECRRSAPSNDAHDSGTGATTAPVHKGTGTTISKWNQAIDIAARNGDVEKAEQLLLACERSGDHPEAVSYNLVLRACAKRGDAVAAERLFRRMEGKGVQATVCSYNTLLEACAKAGKPDACEMWLNRMLGQGIEPNVISYASAIYAHARRGDVAAAEAWLQKMIVAGVQPDAVSFTSLIHACAAKGAVASAERWLQEMESQGLETGVATYTAVIDACAKSGDIDRAEVWFTRMADKGVVPNAVTFSAMIDACAKAGNLVRAEHWHERMLEHGIAPNVHSCSAVINACAKQFGPSGAEAAEKWLDRSERAGVMDEVVYSSVIDACGKAGDAERALRVFDRMRANGFKPNIIAYAALARPYAYRGDWIKVETIAQSMRADGVAVNEFFLYAQLLSYATSRPRQVERAEACFRSALGIGVQANDHVVGALARVVGRERCAGLMVELCNGRSVPSPPSRQGQEKTARPGSTRIGGGGGASARMGRQ